MKDSLDQLFRARFQGHEVPVDPSAWKAIQGQLAAMAASGDGLNELLRDKFKEHEVEVDPSVWEGINSQLGHGAATSTTVAGAAWGWMAAAAGTVLLGAGVWFWTAQDQGAVQPEVQVAQVTAPVLEEVASGTLVPEAGRPTTDLVVVVDAPEHTLQSGQPGTVMVPKKLQGPRIAPSSSTGDDASRPKADGPIAPAGPSGPSVPAPLATGTDRVERIMEELAVKARLEAAKPETIPSPVAVVSLPVEPEMEVEQGEPAEALKLFIPNVFTPNGDGVNDTYQVVGEGFERILVKVFAMKNNQLVFSTNTGEAWTGANCEEGMYLVAVEALTADGRAITEGKVVWLNRTPMN